MPNENSRNTVIFIVCAGLLLVAYQFLVMGPAQRKAEADAKQKAAAVAQAQPGIGAPGMPGDPAAPVYVARPPALAATPRVQIETPALTGSISLKGARFDDLFLKDYRQTLDKASPPVEMFRPEGMRYAYFAQTGWAGQNLPGLPDQDTVWSIKQGGVLTPTQPVVLTYDNGQGLVFDRAISVDDRFMFTIKDTVTNRAAMPVTLAPYASVQRQGLANPKGASGVHEGAISVLGVNDEFRLKLRKYAPWKKDGEYALPSTGGWLGVTDKYWLAAMIPDQREGIRGQFRVSPIGGVDVYDANYVGAPRNLAPGFQASATTHLFAGAKTVPVLRSYGETLSIPRFVDAVDWGWGYFITKPIFYLIELFYGWIGNFGLAILMMTVVVKVAFFYPANLSFESMTKMKKVQPQLEKLKAAHKDDPSGMQQAMMRLYKEEKINPMLGCLPMLATIPVFIGLFHVLNVSIEMRHAPFFGWIRDLSAPDPTTIWNLFGLIPWDPGSIPVIGQAVFNGPLHLGAWPLLYGFTMWLTQSMSPPAADPMQQKILMWMPIIFTFVMAQFAAGLLIYYTWSNVLTILQQYVIMRRFKVDTPIDKVIRKVTGKPAPVAG